MKNIRSLFFALITLATLGLSANKLKSQMVVACPVDTVEYAVQKSSGESTTELYAGNVEGIAQWFELPQNLTLHGISIRAGVKTNGSLNKTATLILSIYNSAMDSMPQALPVITTTVNIDTVYKTYRVPLLTALPVSNNYLISVEYGGGATDTDTVLVGLNQQGDGAQESLGAALFSTGGTTVWLPFENVLTAPDRDAFLFPWVSYDLTSDFVLPGDSQCVDEALLFMNASSPIAGHRMYNQRVISPGTYGDAFSWDLAGIPSNAMDPMRTFTTAGSKTIVLTTSLTGYYNSCTEPVVKSLVAVPRPVSAFTASATTVAPGDTIHFTNGSAGSGTCTWNFGDSTIVADCADQAHVYDTTGTYKVMLMITSPYGCTEVDSTTITVMGPLAIQNPVLQQEVEVFPVPTTNELNAKWNRVWDKEVRLSITNLQGRMFWNKNYSQQNFATISVNELPAGIYFLTIQDEEFRKTTKFVKQE